MEKIELRNHKTESIIAAIFTLGLSALMFYWGLIDKIEISVSGADMGPGASSILLTLIGIITLLVGISYITRYVSLLSYTDFGITMDAEKLTYPEKTAFKGFKRLEIPKTSFGKVQISEVKRNEFIIHLLHSNGGEMGRIDGNMIHYKTQTPQEAAVKIQRWIQS